MDRTRLLVPNRANTLATSRLSLSAVSAEAARLTPRDRWLLGLLGEHQVLSTEQIATAAYSSRKRALNRLGELYQRDILDRFRHYVRPGSQSWRWTLGPVGAGLLASSAGKPMPRPSAVRDATARLVLSPTLAHLLGINGFFTALLGHARTRGDDGAALARWWSEAQATAECGGAARPDGGGIWQEHGATVPFWLEWDTGTERPLSRVAAKLTGYGHLAGTQAGHPVLFWFPNALRETHFHAHLARHAAPTGVIVATASSDYADTSGGPAGAVWSVAGQPGRVRLADLPAGGQQWGG